MAKSRPALHLFRFADDFLSFWKGQVVFEEGQSGESMYVVKTGTVELRVGGRPVEDVQAGGILGEMSLIEKKPRSAMAVAKTGMSSWQIFSLAVICTWALQTSAFLYIKANEDIAKIAMAAYGPLAFVAGMTEHCIANIGFLALPLFQQDLFLRLGEKALTEAPILLHWGFGQYGWAHNQLYTIMGNFIGGIFFVGIVFQLVSHPKRVVAIYKNKTSRMLKL